MDNVAEFILAGLSDAESDALRNFFKSRLKVSYDEDFNSLRDDIYIYVIQ